MMMKRGSMVFPGLQAGDGGRLHGGVESPGLRLDGQIAGARGFRGAVQGAEPQPGRANIHRTGN